MSNEISMRSPEVEAMAKEWAVIEALKGGTPSMRAAGKALMPMQPREDEEDYKYRLGTATLFPAFRRTVGVMAGKPFSKGLTLSDDVSDRIKNWCEDCDLQGRNLHAFSAVLLSEVMNFGLAGVLIEHHKRKDGEKNTQFTDEANGYRPYFSLIKHDSILGWRVRDEPGPMRLAQLRLSESATVNDGDFGTRKVNRVRVLTPGAYQVWEERENVYILIEEGKTTLREIPFVPFYGEQVGFMVARPPLLDLAYQNVKHWQTQSDQDDNARFCRKRLLVLMGVESDKPLTMASNHAITLPLTGDAKIVQGGSESVKAGRSELEALEDQMTQTGAELLVQKPGNRTATEANNDSESNKSELLRIVEAFEDALDWCLYFMGAWVGDSKTGSVSLYKDFSAMSLSDASANTIMQMVQFGIITKQTAIREQQRRGMLDAAIDPGEELEAVAEDVGLGTIGTNE